VFESALQRCDRERKEAIAAKLAQLNAVHERRPSTILDVNVLNFLIAQGVRVNPAQLVATDQGWINAALMQQRAATVRAAARAQSPSVPHTVQQQHQSSEQLSNVLRVGSAAKSF
jgi:hypothetical protein